jgi:hypothetical protein
MSTASAATNSPYSHLLRNMISMIHATTHHRIWDIEYCATFLAPDRVCLTGSALRRGIWEGLLALQQLDCSLDFRDVTTANQRVCSYTGCQPDVEYARSAKEHSRTRRAHCRFWRCIICRRVMPAQDEPSEPKQLCV